MATSIASCKTGVGIYKPNSLVREQPPLLGMQALDNAKTLLLIDSEKRVVSLHGEEAP